MKRFSVIYVESGCKDHPRTRRILERVSADRMHDVRKVEDVFGRVKRPYLHKRDDLRLFIGQKAGDLVKPAPPAYGLGAAPHYYFVHQYNCVYECQYCYLQGYFDSPDLVVYVNTEDICQRLIALTEVDHANEPEVWFHAGEFSDSLALHGVTHDWDDYWPTFGQLERARFELRTKSVNIRRLLDLEPLPNVTISFSIAPEEQTRIFDLRTPPATARLKAAATLAAKGFNIGFHCDPIIDGPDLEESYAALARLVHDAVPDDRLSYVSIGVIRFAKDSYRAVERHYPDSPLHAAEFITADDGKVRYRRAQRHTILRTVERTLLDAGVASDKVYWCMED